MAVRIQYIMKKLSQEENPVDLFLAILECQGLLAAKHQIKVPQRVLFWRKWNKIVLFVQTFNVAFHCPATIYYFWGDVISTSEIVGALFAFAIVAVHLYSLLYREECFVRLRIALKDMRELGRLHRDHAKEVIDEGRKLARITVTYFLVCSIVLMVVAILIMPVFAMIKRELMVKFWWPFDVKARPVFELMLVIRVTTETYGFLLVVLDNALILSILAQITFQLKLLNNNIASIVSSVSDTRGFPVRSITQGKEPSSRDHQSYVREPRVAENSPTLSIASNNREELNHLDEIQHLEYDTLVEDSNNAVVTVKTCGGTEEFSLDGEDRLMQCVKHHQKIAYVVEEVQSAFGPILLFQMSCVVCPVIGTIVLILYGQVIDEKTYSFMGLMFVATTQLLLTCFLAEKVTEESEGVRDAVYGCDWLRAPESFKRSVRIMMSRSNQPIVIKLLGIPWSMETFASVLKLTFSYYTSLSATLQTGSSPEKQPL